LLLWLAPAAHRGHTQEANFFLFFQVDCSLVFCCPSATGIFFSQCNRVCNLGDANCFNLMFFFFLVTDDDRKGMWLLLIFWVTVLYLCFFLMTPLALFLVCCFFGWRAKCMFLESRNQISGFSRNFKHCFWISVLYYIYFRNISTVAINSIIRNILIVFHYYVVWVFFIKSEFFGCSLGLFGLVWTLFHVVLNTVT